MKSYFQDEHRGAQSQTTEGCLAKVQNNHVKRIVGTDNWIQLTKLSCGNASIALSLGEKDILQHVYTN